MKILNLPIELPQDTCCKARPDQSADLTAYLLDPWRRQPRACARRSSSARAAATRGCPAGGPARGCGISGRRFSGIFPPLQRGAGRISPGLNGTGPGCPPDPAQQRQMACGRRKSSSPAFPSGRTFSVLSGRFSTTGLSLRPLKTSPEQITWTACCSATR